MLADQKTSLEKEPEAFLCLISYTMMTDPVFSGSWHIFDRQSIETTLKMQQALPRAQGGTGKSRHPHTGKLLLVTQLISHRALKKAIEEYQQDVDYRHLEKYIVLLKAKLITLNNRLRDLGGVTVNAIPQYAEEGKPVVNGLAFLDPLTGKFFKEPMLTPEGYTYEKEPLLAWIEEKHTDPIALTPLVWTEEKQIDPILQEKKPIPDKILSKAILELRASFTADDHCHQYAATIAGLNTAILEASQLIAAADLIDLEAKQLIAAIKRKQGWLMLGVLVVVLVSGFLYGFLLWRLSCWCSSEPTVLPVEMLKSETAPLVPFLEGICPATKRLVNMSVSMALKTVTGDILHQTLEWSRMARNAVAYRAWEKYHIFMDGYALPYELAFRMLERVNVKRGGNQQDYRGALKYLINHDIEEFKKIDFNVIRPSHAPWPPIGELVRIVAKNAIMSGDVVTLSQLIALNRPEFFYSQTRYPNEKELRIEVHYSIEEELKWVIFKKEMGVLDLITKANLLPRHPRDNLLANAVEHLDLKDPLSLVLIERFAKNATQESLLFACRYAVMRLSPEVLGSFLKFLVGDTYRTELRGFTRSNLNYKTSVEDAIKQGNIDSILKFLKAKVTDGRIELEVALTLFKPEIAIKLLEHGALAEDSSSHKDRLLQLAMQRLFHHEPTTWSIVQRLSELASPAARKSALSHSLPRSVRFFELSHFPSLSPHGSHCHDPLRRLFFEAPQKTKTMIFPCLMWSEQKICYYVE